MDISKFDKADVLRVLYNYAKPQGMGLLHYNSEVMAKEIAQAIIDTGQTYFDYLRGRVMKIDLSTNELKTALYNRDNGEGAAERLLKEFSNDKVY